MKNFTKEKRMEINQKSFTSQIEGPLENYENQRKEGKIPIFKGSSIGLNEEELDYWK